MKAPLPDNETERLEALRHYRILDTAGEQVFDDLVVLTSQFFQAPIALISLVDVDRQWFKSKVGLTEAETPRAVAFCSHTILQTEPLIVPDACRDERFASNPLVTGAPNIRFYAGAPLITPEGHVLGTLNVIDNKPRQFSHQQMEALCIMARQVMTQLELRRSAERLAVVNEQLGREVLERKHAEAALRRLSSRNELILWAAGDGIYGLDTSGNATFVNPAAARMTGWSVEELVGQPLHDILHHSKPDGTPHPREECPVHSTFGDGEFHRVTDDVFWRKDGTKFPVAYLSTPMREGGELVGAVVTFNDVTERRRAEERLKTSREQLRALSARLQSAREEEGARIAREIHDELGSALTGLKWDLEWIEKTVSKAEADLPSHRLIRDKIDSMTNLLDDTIGAVRRISSELRPGILDDLGLTAAVEWQAQQFQSRTGIGCVCRLCVETVDLDRDKSTAVFRIFQEILTNILRHARASRVEIAMLSTEDSFVLEVKDDGRGIREDEELSVHSLGILGMRERAHLAGGEVDIKGVEGRGTVVTVRVPISGSTPRQNSSEGGKDESDENPRRGRP